MGKLVRANREDFNRASWWIASFSFIVSVVGVLNLIFDWFTDWILICSFISYVVNMINMIENRKEKRDEYAERVCRELRYQIVKYGLVGDWKTMTKHLDRWMKVAKKNKWERPK